MNLVQIVNTIQINLRIVNTIQIALISRDSETAPPALYRPPQTGKTTPISVSGPPETPRTSQHYRIGGFKGAESFEFSQPGLHLHPHITKHHFMVNNIIIITFIYIYTAHLQSTIHTKRKHQLGKL